MAEIGQVCGPNNQVSPAATARNGKALSPPAQVRPTESTGTPRQVRLPVEHAVREVARSVIDYIVTNRLTRDEGYQAFKAELVSTIPKALLSINEMELIDKLSQDLLDRVAMNAQNTATTEPGPISVVQAGEKLMAGNLIGTPASGRPEQMLEIINPVPPEAPVPAEAGSQQPDTGRHESPETPMGQRPSGPESSSVAPVTAGASQQPDPGRPSAVSGQNPNPSDLLRVDLKEILSGKPAELHIRRDEALIMSKVAVLIEQMNGMIRVYEEQDRGASRSRQKPLLNVNLSLRQVLAAALGIVIDGNKAFNSPASIGVSAGRDGLLALDPTLLKSALESHRNEAVIVLKSMANSFYDNISLYVDPRILVRFSELLGIDVAGKANRSRKESERRWKKDKELLEKRFLELALVLEESGKLRDWLMNVVESFGRNVPDSEPSDEVSKRALPAVDLFWDQEGIVSVDGSPEELKESLVTLFVGCTTRALQEEDADASIKLLLKRKSLSDKLLTVRPDLEPKAAMICLANEELIIGRIEAERQKLFKSLDELSRTTVAARGYRSQFPFPPPMAAFITSEG